MSYLITLCAIHFDEFKFIQHEGLLHNSNETSLWKLFVNIETVQGSILLFHSYFLGKFYSYVEFDSFNNVPNIFLLLF